MTTVSLTILAVLAIAALYIVLPVMAHTYRQLRGAWIVECPEEEVTASIELDARHAATSAAFGDPQVRVTTCSYWPEREGCDQSCLG